MWPWDGATDVSRLRLGSESAGKRMKRASRIRRAARKVAKQDKNKGTTGEHLYRGEQSYFLAIEQ